MDFEQIVKRLQWLDEEHRKDKAIILALQERISALEGNIDAVAKQVKPLEKQISGISPIYARLDQFDAIFARQREDMNSALEEIENRHQKREQEVTKQHQKDFEPIYKEIEKVKTTLTELPQIKRDIKTRMNEEARLYQAVKELRPPIDEAMRVAEQAMLMQRSFDESRKQEAKRVADLQGEIAALRKRIEEARSKADLVTDSWKNMDNRIKELMLSESERKAAQTAFIEKQTIAQIDRDRAYKEWRDRYDDFQKQVETLETQSTALEETLRSAKRAQETYNELNTKLERRINEMTEMQRLAEERLRQEWVTFKADDQKRWTGYTLSQDEGIKDARRFIQKLDERINTLDESAQILQDQLHQTTDATEQQLQELMNVAHEWLSAYERIMGHGKTTAKKTKK
jgi:chromosome segregation ATPase